MAIAWRVLVDPPASGAWNMAVDEALARQLAPNTRVLRLYEWFQPTVSFGRNQPALGSYALDRASELGFEFVRRPTGGRAVLHDRELTYAVVLPDHSFGGPREIYVRIQSALADALRAAGAADVQQEPASDRAAPRPSTQPCFGAALPGEVTLSGKKVVGSAQARIGKTVLQHGAILTHNNQRGLDQLTQGERIADAAGPTTLREHGIQVTPSDLARHVVGAFEDSLPGAFAPSELTHAERAAAEDLLKKFESHEWTWRR